MSDFYLNYAHESVYGVAATGWFQPGVKKALSRIDLGKPLPKYFHKHRKNERGFASLADPGISGPEWWNTRIRAWKKFGSSGCLRNKRQERASNPDRFNAINSSNLLAQEVVEHEGDETRSVIHKKTLRDRTLLFLSSKLFQQNATPASPLACW